MHMYVQLTGIMVVIWRKSIAITQIITNTCTCIYILDTNEW